MIPIEVKFEHEGVNVLIKCDLCNFNDEEKFQNMEFFEENNGTTKYLDPEIANEIPDEIIDRRLGEY